MNVLQLTKFYPPVMGGIESVAFELTEGLNQRGIATEVLCANVSRKTVVDRSPSGYRVTRAASWGKLLSTSMAPAMLRLTGPACRRVDIVHVHLPDPLTNLALWLHNPKAKLVVHWHSDIVAQQRALRVYAPLQQWLLRKASAIIATSTSYADSSPWLRQFRDKVTVIPIGIRDPLGSVPPGAADLIRQRHVGKRIVLALGRMTYYKGFDVLIDAAAALPEDCVVVVGGSGELLDVHRTRIRLLGLQDRIAFVGRIPDAELSAYYAAASVFCLPSIARSEAFGVVLLEAMAMAKPIVATDITGSGVPWVNVHGETGLNVAPNDGQALAQGLCDVLRDPDSLARFARNGRARYMEQFRADTMVDRTRLLYEHLR